MSFVESVGIPNSTIPFTDKILHFSAYVVLSFLWSQYTTKRFSKISTNKVLTIIAAILTIYGMIIEVLQSLLTVNRVSEIKDVIANMLGIAIGIVVFKKINKYNLKSNKGLFF